MEELINQYISKMEKIVSVINKHNEDNDDTEELLALKSELAQIKETMMETISKNKFLSTIQFLIKYQIF